MVERTCSPLRTSGECGFRQPLRGLRVNYPDRRLCPKLVPALRPTASAPGPRGTPPLLMPARGPGPRARGLGCRTRWTEHRGPGRLPARRLPKGDRSGGLAGPSIAAGRVWEAPLPMERPLHGWAGVCSPGQREARPTRGRRWHGPVRQLCWTGRSRPLGAGRPTFHRD